MPRQAAGLAEPPGPEGFWLQEAAAPAGGDPVYGCLPLWHRAGRDRRARNRPGRCANHFKAGRLGDGHLPAVYLARPLPAG